MSENDNARPQIQTHPVTRRALCAGIGSLAALALIGAAGTVPAEASVRPPGGADEQRMLSRCIRCQKCYEVCERRVIRPSQGETGPITLRMPVMSFSESFCDFCAEANGGTPLCAQCCPTGALDVEEARAAERAGLGRAQLVREWCLAHQLNGCRFCYDACAYDAIELDELGRPAIIAERCNGCGACEAACVSLKEGSITAGATARAITVVPVRQ